MGDVVSIASFVRDHPKSISNKEKDYATLRAVETCIFGSGPEESFLEMIAGERMKSDNPMHPLEEASYLFGLDFCNTRYTEFQNHEPEAYLDFIERTIMYYQNHEPQNITAIDRLFSFVRHLYRYEMGLPKLSDTNMIHDNKSTILGRLEYRIREYLVQRKLAAFKEKTMKYK
jgi:hypothetical protein